MRSRPAQVRIEISKDFFEIIQSTSFCESNKNYIPFALAHKRGSRLAKTNFHDPREIHHGTEILHPKHIKTTPTSIRHSNHRKPKHRPAVKRINSAGRYRRNGEYIKY